MNEMLSGVNPWETQKQTQITCRRVYHVVQTRQFRNLNLHAVLSVLCSSVKLRGERKSQSLQWARMHYRRCLTKGFMRERHMQSKNHSSIILCVDAFIETRYGVTVRHSMTPEKPVPVDAFVLLVKCRASQREPLWTGSITTFLVSFTTFWGPTHDAHCSICQMHHGTDAALLVQND